MIEFKAECGHTIRAKDEDEGKVVRCSYCGRETQVPVAETDDLDSLFAEVEASESQVGAGVSRKARRAMKRSAGVVVTSRGGATFNPFAVAMKMAYAAAIIIVLIVVGKYAYQYWTTLDLDSDQQRAGVAREGEERERAPGGKRRDRGGRGLLDPDLGKKKRGGLYVSSVPGAALVRVRAREDGESCPTASELFYDPDLETHRTNKSIELKDGQYDVVVAVKLGDPHLMDYPGYVDLRREIEHGSPAVLDRFFMPDEAVEVGTIEAPNLGNLLFRRYERRVIGTDWTPLTSLFLPYGSVCSLVRHLPRKESYGFDETYVKRELSYYKVPEQDQRYLMDALRRVGMVMYQPPGKHYYRRFSLHLTDGTIVSKEHEDPRPPGMGGPGAGPAPRGAAGVTGRP